MQTGDVCPQRAHTLCGRGGILRAKQVRHHAAPACMRLARHALDGFIGRKGHHRHNIRPGLTRHGAQAGAAIHYFYISKNGHAKAGARELLHRRKPVAQHKAGAHLYDVRIFPRRTRKGHGLGQCAPFFCAVQRQLQRHLCHLFP